MVSQQKSFAVQPDGVPTEDLDAAQTHGEARASLPSKLTVTHQRIRDENMKLTLEFEFPLELDGYNIQESYSISRYNDNLKSRIDICIDPILGSASTNEFMASQKMIKICIQNLILNTG